METLVWILAACMLAALVLIAFLCWNVADMARDRASSDSETILSLKAMATVAQEKALAFSDEQREVMRIQRDNPAARVDAPNPQPAAPLPPPNFKDGAEFRVGD